MSDKFVGQGPCIKCDEKYGYTTNDKIVQIYERDDGRISATCMSCKYHYNYDTRGGKMDARTSSSNANQLDVNTIRTYPSLGLNSRGIVQNVVEYFKVKTHVYENKPAHFYPYGEECYKIRILPKEFRVIGKANLLFGQQEFPKAGKMLVITEGEIDALSVAQASFELSGKIWPVVSLPSANQLNLLLEQRAWIRSFNKVILWLDNDDVGKKALQQAAKIIGYDKVKVVNASYKDANDVLLKDGAKAVNEAIWGAQSYSPAGIITGMKIYEKYQERKNVESVPYPECLDGLNKKLKGMRYGEITLFTSGTGSGKSTVIKEIILDLLTKTKDKIGLISLEESIGDTAEKFIHMVLKRPSLDSVVSETEERAAALELFNDERLVLLDHQGSVGDSSLIDKIEYMALMGCKYLVLDHITIAVSEGTEGLEGNAAIDKIMSDLLKLTKKHDIWLGVISHLRKSGGKAFEEGNMASIDDIKGSGSIKQISFDIIAFSRNLTAESESERNQINLAVLKSRFTGLTGPAGKAVYSKETGRLTNADMGFNFK